VRLAATFLLTLALGAGAVSAAGAGRYVSGTDQSRVVPPAGAVIQPYANAGYELRFVAGAIEVRVDLEPLESSAPYQAPAADRDGRLVGIARDLTADATTRYQAVTSLLGWVRENVRYELDRTKPQDPLAVLERGSAYCTGIARLSVALLRAAGIEAREVPGYVLEDLASGPRAGFHRWVEVYYPDRGWVFSDPVATLNYVPASYVRLADERLQESPGDGRIVAREARIAEIDRASGVPEQVRVRRNGSEREAAALVVLLDGATRGEAILEGPDGRRVAPIVGGEGRILGLEPGSYILRVEAAGRTAARKSIVFHAPVLAEVTIPVPVRAPAFGGGR